ncbi:efflux RND transporter periplasmic adaptor subunit [Pseudomonas fluorescens]|uniref:efflux RND transporter periplasmic adaptor subunit n=1 Tax=Pseudomonas fluorescens TaxID=294 RepID=UPI003747A87E
MFMLAALSAAVAVVVIGITHRQSIANQLEVEAALRSVPTVAVVSPTAVIQGVLQLPARIEAWSRAPIYARVGGYLKDWSVDIGSPVKAGQVLAQIDTPELDQQLLQAQAELATAKSEAAQALVTAQRWQSMLKSDSVSRQEVDERTNDLATRRSVVNARQANVDRMLALQRYKRIVAPFDGVVTARNTDVGALINVGMATGGELFVVSDTRRLRVYVNVPQRQVAMIQPGSRALVSVPERPGKTYAATVQSLSQAVDIGSGAMRVQLSLNNDVGELLPGAFATVRFESQAQAAAIGLPPGALIIGKKGVQVATVNSQGVVALKSVTVARDHGTFIELADGISGLDQVIANPPDGLGSGDQVRIASAKTEAAK